MTRQSRDQSGFTLIEVTLGLTILILIFGVIFQLVQFSVMGANAAAQASLRSREVSGLFALVRQLCLDLPVNSQLSLGNRDGRDVLEIINAPVAIFPEQYDGVRVLGFELRKARTGDSKELWMVESIIHTNTGKTEKPEVNEFRLMEDVKKLSWEAGDTRKPQDMYQPAWSDSVKPAFLSVKLERQAGKKTLTNTALFWIPAGMNSSGQAPIDQVTRSLMVSTNSTNPPSSQPTQ